jgi:hypothetical protein
MRYAHVDGLRDTREIKIVFRLVLLGSYAITQRYNVNISKNSNCNYIKPFDGMYMCMKPSMGTEIKETK